MTCNHERCRFNWFWCYMLGAAAILNFFQQRDLDKHAARITALEKAASK